MPSLLSSNARSNSLDEAVEQPAESRHSTQRSISSVPHDATEPITHDYATHDGSSSLGRASGSQITKSFSGPGEASSSTMGGPVGHSRSRTSPVRRSISEFGTPALRRPMQPPPPTEAFASPQKSAVPPEGKALRKGKGLLGKSLQALRSAGHSSGKRYSVAAVPAGSNEGIGGVPQLRTVSEEREEGGKRPRTPPLARMY
jgi:hypothetical protein